MAAAPGRQAVVTEQALAGGSLPSAIFQSVRRESQIPLTCKQWSPEKGTQQD